MSATERQINNKIFGLFFFIFKTCYSVWVHFYCGHYHNLEIQIKRRIFLYSHGLFEEHFSPLTISRHILRTKWSKMEETTQDIQKCVL